MDPNANLQEQAFLLPPPLTQAESRRLSELRRSLQEWLSRGGFEPTWNRHPEATKAFRAWQRKMQKFGDLAR